MSYAPQVALMPPSKVESSRVSAADPRHSYWLRTREGHLIDTGSRPQRSGEVSAPGPGNADKSGPAEGGRQEL